ncbi:SusC/RagA family TonB-linked outer membrane protein [Chitinophaga lutea]|uniref:SusC/RagA family TonB-linked outer membrane protein n=1 Tax=Chitinophaga lutea TaxID=2488634 RepID=A0A3N4Q0Y6_9BACT|nr:SusC/RagA family TonB-linked outer membrane protein [Chitinophaga lutea]RPE12849.1 SusC/RagA family TonB-linked outer membrane protein [Chitinophaga lutea]
MRITLLGGLILLGSHQFAYSQTYATSKMIPARTYGASAQQTSLSTLLADLEAALNVKFSYNAALIGHKKVRAASAATLIKNGWDRELRERLQQVGLTMTPNGLQHYIIKPVEAIPFVQQHTITAPVERIEVRGVIKDSATQAALPGVAVGIKGTLIGTMSSPNGEYSLKNVPDNAVLVFNMLGYRALEVPVNGRSSINIEMATENRVLDQFVVTALGIKREEKSLGYAVQKISGDAVQTVKGTNIGTALTGKVSGLLIKNSTEFFQAPSIELRGASPLLVIDGVPYGNLSLRDISPDDIESMDILKGATAAALYGQRGGAGAIIIVTKKGNSGKGLSVSVNSNTMFTAGFLALPKGQTSYSAGLGGEYDPTDYVWGAKLDIGQKAMQWNPETKQMENMELTSRGKDNFRNFLETGYVTNNNISVAQTGEYGSFRVSMSHIHDKGQYPNAKLDMMNFTVGGEIKLGDRFSLESHMGYNKRLSPQIAGKGYGDQGYIYNILMWTGPEYDLSKYRDYWVTPHEKQNWMYNAWYDNPYLMAYEKLRGIDQNTLNASITMNYKLFEGAKVIFRSGWDYYGNNETRRNPKGINATRGWHALGMYSQNRATGYSTNNDLILTYDKKFGDFAVDALAGGTVYYYKDEYNNASTRNGLSIPGFYSLASSVERADVTASQSRKQVNSLFAKASLGWRNRVFLDVTGRNDWSSSLPKNTGSYFYPSYGASVVLSEFMQMPAWLTFWKVRGSWAQSKNDIPVYATNRTYTITSAAWEAYNAATYPTNLLGADSRPRTDRTWEIGSSAYFLKKRIRLDATYYNKFTYNLFKEDALISSASGFRVKAVNIDETYVRRGIEVTADATVLKQGKFQWETIVNWSTSRRYYKSLDSVYSADNLWTKVGARTDAATVYAWERDPQGNLIHQSNGMPLDSDYPTRIGYSDPDWIWGWGNTFTYGNFSLSFNFDGRVGGLLNNYTNSKMWDTGSHPDSDNPWRYDEVVNGKTNYVGEGVKVVSGSAQRDKYGQITKDDRVYAKNDKAVSYESYARNYQGGVAGGLLDPTFLKLRDLSLGYRLPASAAARIGARSASVAITGQNLLLKTKEFRFVDPDSGNDDVSSPSLRYIGMNLKVTF